MQGLQRYSSPVHFGSYAPFVADKGTREDLEVFCMLCLEYLVRQERACCLGKNDVLLRHDYFTCRFFVSLFKLLPKCCEALFSPHLSRMLGCKGGSASVGFPWLPKLVIETDGS